MTETATPAPHPSHGTPTTPRVTVRGEAHLEADPEIARIAVTLTARNTDRRTTLDDLNRRNTATLDLIKGYGDTIEKLETGTLTIRPELARHGRGERIRAYHGSIQLTATLNDFTVLGEIVARLADQELTRIDGPWWALRPTSPHHAAARRQAVQEALQRAREYAEALGTHIDALLELSDTGTLGGATFTTATYGGGVLRSARAENAPETAPVDLEPVRQNVDAQVEAAFTLIPPNLG
ncbi:MULTISPECIES: SIMPL domain-containing protein [unclassified Streptomyces]|uniref:SIMPL domain-containing protein n=1 Tax=unclassified Streptomyces TaxID=2593676 RepID=UPI000851ACFE|nr:MULTISPECIES: SIMPL domain-containing protein [unclassified Streptomyces]